MLHIIVDIFLKSVLLRCVSEPFMRNGRPPTSHSMHSFLHQYTGSFKKPPLRRPHSVIGGSLGSFMAMPRNGSRLGEARTRSPTHLPKQEASGRGEPGGAGGIRRSAGSVSPSQAFPSSFLVFERTTRGESHEPARPSALRPCDSVKHDATSCTG